MIVSCICYLESRVAVQENLSVQPKSLFWFACKLFQRIPDFGNTEQHLQYGIEEGYSSGSDADSQWDEEDSLWLEGDSEDDSDDSGWDGDYDVDLILAQTDLTWQDELRLSHQCTKQSRFLTLRGLSM